jgi:hypothetical protein
MDSRILLSALLLLVLPGTGFSNGPVKIIECVPDTLGEVEATYIARGKDPKESFTLRIYGGGNCLLDYFDVGEGELTKNACSGQYQKKGKNLWIRFDCQCLDVTKEPQLFRRRFWGLKLRSGQLREFYSLKKFRRQ